MWSKHRSAYQDHMKHVRNDIVKPFKVKILRYAERIREMHDLENYLPPSLMKGEIEMEANWNVRNEELTESDIRLAIRDGLPKSMRDELNEHPEEYCYLTYKDWCELLSTIDVKYERKRAAVRIKKIASAREASLYDNDKSVRIPRNNKDRTGVLIYNKYPKKVHRHHRIQCYCVLYNKAGTPERKYTSHSANDFTCVRINQYIKYGMVGPVGSRTNAMKQYKKSEKM